MGSSGGERRGTRGLGMSLAEGEWKWGGWGGVGEGDTDLSGAWVEMMREAGDKRQRRG